MASPCACVDFLQLSLTSAEDFVDDGDDGDNFYDINRICSLDERRIIAVSSQNCSWCRKIYIILQDLYGDQYYLPNEEDWPSTRISMNYSNLHSEKRLISSVTLTGDLETGYARELPRINFAVWADQGTPACAKFVQRSPILHGYPQEVAHFASMLLEDCLSHHEECRLYDPAGEMTLPSRVLCIKDNDGDISVTLVQSQSLTGRYCALSHCWGPEHKRPLRTTRENITEHLASIFWESLPPLFQDAITLTKGIGIDYLWIDSLCIVQDDKQDWLNESLKMASIYQRATLVIAAVDSENSTQRLSKAKRPEPLTIRLPYYTQDESAQGTYCLAECMPLHDEVDGPLLGRGWVFQEIYLGRRKIFFSSRGVSWSCIESEMTERGNSCDLVLHQSLSWSACLSIYTEKKLTYPSDRITALLGIVAEMGESRDDAFVSEYGVWDSELAEQLLWRLVEIPNQDSPHLPSWCWAATGGAKDWLHTEILQQAVVKGSTQTVKLKGSGSIGASGSLMRAKISFAPMQECCIKNYTTASWQVTIRTDGIREWGLEEYILPGWTTEHYDIRRFTILNHNGDRDPCGLAVFDGLAYYPECFLFVLASSRRKSLDPWYSKTSTLSSMILFGLMLLTSFPKSDKRSPGGEKTGEGKNEEVRQGHVHSETNDCVDIAKVGQSKEAYWALLLQPVDGTTERFKRVGMALLWQRALEAQQHEVTEFELV